DRDPADDLGHLFRFGAHLRGEGVDVQGNAYQEVAVVVWTGDRRGDGNQAQRGAFQRPGQVELAHRVERVRAGTGGDVGGTYFARGGTAGRCLLGFAGLLNRRRDRALRAI